MDRYLLQLMMSRGIGTATIKKIIQAIKSGNDHSFDDYCKDPVLLRDVLFRPRSIESTVQSIAENEEPAAMMVRQLDQEGVSVITEMDDDYPQTLMRELGKDCPPVLFVKGNKELLNSRGVGFCGSRKVSEKGIAITRQCASQLAGKEITVISGYAGGTDIAAHKAALEAGGTTVFVLAEGILEYRLKKEIREYLNNSNHLFVSQFLPKAAWNASNAMRRNSLIIGLSKAMILIESGKKGGTFAAGEESLKRKTPLFVVDYAKPEVSAEANPYFIEQGASPIRSRKGRPNLDKIINLPEQQDSDNMAKQLSLF